MSVFEAIFSTTVCYVHGCVMLRLHEKAGYRSIARRAIVVLTMCSNRTLCAFVRPNLRFEEQSQNCL